MDPEEAKEGRNDKKKKTKEITVFELCEVCNLNHDQGRRHRYQASHRRSLSALLSRFQSKLTDLRFFLRNPAPLRPEHSALSRLWCVFCTLDLHELGSPFACSNALNHLAGPEHLTNLKDFLRKHGGAMDQIDSFRVSDADFIKWEKGCSALKSATSSLGEGPIGQQPGPPSKDIRNELTSNHADCFKNNSFTTFTSCVLNAVMPLQSITSEDYRFFRSEVGRAESTGDTPYVATSLLLALQGNMGSQYTRFVGDSTENLTGGQPKHMGNNGKNLIDSSPSDRVDQRTASGEDCTTVSQSFTRISAASEVSTGSVHTGAPPPWLDTTQENDKDLLIKGPHTSNHAFPLAQTGKSRKLNPNRVGAAWAEKRRTELEMEKKGGPIADSCDANWLPNFGRVWQAGSRKESRKEFEKEKRKFFKDENLSETPFKMQPYISKRMRVASSENDGAINGPVEDSNSTF